MRLKMDWVHCNNCFLLPDRDKCFFLTSCGHIYCSDCEAQCARGLCKLCGNQCSSLVLSSSMKPDVQMYFTDPDVLLKKKLREIHQITEFQKNHRARLAAYYRKQNIKFRQMRDDFKKILKSIKDLDSERAKLAKENECLKKCLRMPSASSSSKSSNNAAFTPSFGSFENTPPPYTHMNPMFANLFGKLDNSGASSSMSCMPERVSVFSPPTNGKIGSIPDTPSSAFRKMSLSSAHFSENVERRNDSQDSSPASSQESVLELNRYSSYPGRRQTNEPRSPIDPWPSQNQMNYKGHQNSKDARRVVVRPYSPDE